jgi:hypothetical protein
LTAKTDHLQAETHEEIKPVPESADLNYAEVDDLPW